MDSRFMFAFSLGILVASLGASKIENTVDADTPVQEETQNPFEASQFNWSFDDVTPSEVFTNSEPEIEAQEPPSVQDDEGIKSVTYRVRVRGYDNSGQPSFRSGSSVSIGNGMFVTAKHGFDRLRSFQADIEFSDGWKTGSVRRLANADIAVITVSGVDVPYVETREAEYMESCKVYGLRTEQVQSGICTETDSGNTLGGCSLNPEETGIAPGDSGGGVYGEDGKLIGVIVHRSTTNDRVIDFTPIGYLGNGFNLPSNEPPKSFSQSYSSALEYMQANDLKAVVLSAKWCGPCQSYKPTVEDLEVKIIDVDEEPETYRLLRGSNSVPQTVYVENGKIKRAYGQQTKSWLRGVSQ